MTRRTRLTLGQRGQVVPELIAVCYNRTWGRGDLRCSDG